MSYIHYMVGGLHYTFTCQKHPGERNTMKTPRIYIGALAVFCVAALVIGSAGATAMMQKGTGKGPVSRQPEGERMLLMLDNLTAQGYDVTAIRNAVTTGDFGTAHTLMQEFRTTNPDVFPAPGKDTGKGLVSRQPEGERMLLMLDNLTAQGYDVTAIRNAVTTGDFGTAHTLVQEFRTAHPDAFPAPGKGTGKGPVSRQMEGERMLLMLDNLTAQGYDVTAIRNAVTTGDFGTAHTLVQEFRTTNPAAFPAHAIGTGNGHPGRQWRVQNNE